MFITDSYLHRDIKIFLQNQFYNILLICILVSLITSIISYIMIPEFYFDELPNLNKKNILLGELINSIQNMNFRQKKILLRTTLGGICFSVINYSVLLGIILNLIKQFFLKNKINSIIDLLYLSLLNFVNLAILVLITTFFIQIGFLIFIIPGFLLILLFSLSPCILVIEKNKIFYSIYNSIILLKKNIKLIFPVIFFWIITKFVFIFLIVSLKSFSFNGIFIGYHIINNFMLSILVIYLSKIFLIVKK